MSRSGYSDDIDGKELALWRGQVASAIKGKRGQAFLRELIEALDALPEKKLVAHDFVREGAACALGAVALKRQMDAAKVAEIQRACAQERDEWDHWDHNAVPRAMAREFGIARAMAGEIMWMNDECGMYWDDVAANADERRWKRMRKWAMDNLKRKNRKGLACSD